MSGFDATKEAKKLKKETPIVQMHRTMDGALNGYSVIKSGFDIQHCTESQVVSLDAMHEWIGTPTGLITTFGASLFFTSFAYFGTKNEKNELGVTWQYTREGLQAGRNGFKAVRGGILTAASFTTQNLKYLILPTSLAFGGLYMLNRLYMLKVSEDRKKMIDANQQVFAHIMNYGMFLECNATLPEAKETSDFKNRVVRVEKPSLKFIYYDAQGKTEYTKDNLPEYITNRYILYKNPEGHEQLYYVDIKGEAELIPEAKISQIRAIIKKTGSTHLSLLQLNELLSRNNKSSSRNIAKRHFQALVKQEINKIPLSKQRLYYLIRAFNGLIDGLYLYLGVVLGLASFAPPILLFLTIMSALYCLLCIVSRVYEEYQNQQKLQITQYRIDLALAGRALELSLIQLNEITLAIALETDRIARKTIDADPLKLKALQLQQEKIDERLETHLKQFEEKRNFLKNSYYLSNTETVLIGVKHSLPIYGALISFVFALAFIGLIAGFTIPPVGVIITVALGIPIVAMGILHAFEERLTPPKDRLVEDRKEASKLSKIVQDVKASFKLTYKNAQEEYDAFLKGAYAKNALLDKVVRGLQADPLADTFYADTAEIGRSFWAGLSKGRKAIEMLLNRLQQRDENGHYQDTFLMYMIIIPVALVYAIIFALNAFIKGFTRKNEDTDEFKDQELNIAALEKQRMHQAPTKSAETPIKSQPQIDIQSPQLKESRPKHIAPTVNPAHQSLTGNQFYTSNHHNHTKTSEHATALKVELEKKAASPQKRPRPLMRTTLFDQPKSTNMAPPLKLTVENTRPLRKLAEASKIKHQAGAQNRSVHVVHKDSSTTLMPNFAASVEFPKRSTIQNNAANETTSSPIAISNTEIHPAAALSNDMAPLPLPENQTNAPCPPAPKQESRRAFNLFPEISPRTSSPLYLSMLGRSHSPTAFDTGHYTF